MSLASLIKVASLIKDCNIKLRNTKKLSYEFDEDIEITNRGFRILHALPDKKAIRFQTDDSPEDYVTLILLKELASYQHFVVFSEDEYVHYIIELDSITEL